jgi:hypothetical protein
MFIAQSSWHDLTEKREPSSRRSQQTLRQNLEALHRKMDWKKRLIFRRIPLQLSKGLLLTKVLGGADGGKTLQQVSLQDKGEG